MSDSVSIRVCASMYVCVVRQLSSSCPKKVSIQEGKMAIRKSKEQQKHLLLQKPTGWAVHPCKFRGVKDRFMDVNILTL